MHGTDITLVGKDPAYFEIVKFSIEHSDAITAVSNSLRKQTKSYFKIKKPIDVVHNFFVPQKNLIGDKTVRKKFAKTGEKLIIHSSNYRDIKQPEDVVKIFIEIKKQIPSKLLLLGSGPRLEVVRKMIKDNKIERDVFFLGKNRNIDSFLAISDLLLLPSSQESFGMVALEAMAYGVPVVASLVGGLPEVIESGKSGFLVEAGNIKKMAQISCRLLKNVDLHLKISQNGMKRAQEKFCLSKILPKYLSIYKKAMK